MEQSNLWESIISLLENNWDVLLRDLWKHVYISAISIGIAIAIALPLGIYLTRKRKWSGHIIGVAGAFQTIPSLALFGFLIPFVGVGLPPTIIALVLYALAPIIRNVYTGIIEVNQDIVDAGRGMGMTNWQILWIIELRLAFPVIMAGIRTATVWTIGIATIAAFIGAGGLGELIFRGVALMRNDLILLGAIPAALLAVIAEILLKKVELSLRPYNKRSKSEKKRQVIKVK